MKGVAVVGSVHMDVIATADRLPARGESLTGYRFAIHPGGKAGNQATQAALNGVPAFIVGRVGADGFGDQLRSALARKGVDTTYLTTDEGEPTGASPVLTGADGEYASIIVPGASRRLGRAEIDAARAAFERSAVLLTQLEIAVETTTYAMAVARALGARVIFNASPAPAGLESLPSGLWSNVDWLLVNATEAARLSGLPVSAPGKAEAATRWLRDRLGVPCVIVTLGSDGALIVDGAGTRRVPTWSVAVVETIGAGDAFAGVLASELARGTPLDEAVRLGNAAGALAVTRPGAYDALPTGDEIRVFLAERSAAGDA